MQSKITDAGDYVMIHLFRRHGRRRQLAVTTGLALYALLGIPGIQAQEKPYAVVIGNSMTGEGLDFGALSKLVGTPMVGRIL